MSNLAKVLEAYGFKTKEQQLDVIRLLFLSGCLDPDRLHTDLGATGHPQEQIIASISIVTQACKGQFQPKDIRQFDAEYILNQFFYSVYPILDKALWPEKIHNWLIKVTQREFFARKPGQERWQQETGQWMITYEKEAREISSRLGLESEVSPKEQRYEGIAVFGSTAPEMEKRLAYVKHLVEQRGIFTNQLFLLCGERPADKSVDGDEEYLKVVATNNSVPADKVTETHLMKEAYQKLKGQGLFSSIPLLVIDTPKGNKPRPTTIDTLMEFAKHNSKLAGKILFISRAPNIQAQREDTLAILKEQLPSIIPEVVGASTSSENVALNRLMGAFGGALYGGYARVASELGCQQTRQQLEITRNSLGFTIQPPSSNIVQPPTAKQLTP